MKITVNSVIEIKATKLVPSGDIALLAKKIAGKTATIDIAPSSTMSELIDVARHAFGISPSETFADVFVKRGDRTLDKAMTVSGNGLTDASSVSVQFKYVL
jgi:hypothetical protein